MSAKPFVLIADDYGLSPAVSAGIREALAAGRLSGAGCMTNLPSFRPEAPALAALPGGAQIGLHLTLTAGAPLGAAPRLAPGGELPPVATLIRARADDAALRADVAAEIARQLDAFVDAFGRAPDFVDGHQHVHALAAVRGPLLDELERRGWAGKLWLRDSADSLVRAGLRGVALKKAALVAGLTRGFAAAARARGFALNEGFSGFSAFDPKRSYAADFARFLRAPGPRHLVMCHPGRIDAELARLDPVTTTREHELQFLLSAGFDDVCRRASAVLTQRWLEG